MENRTRHVTGEPHDPRSRFALYRLCDCPTCSAKGQVRGYGSRVEGDEIGVYLGKLIKCPDCRGEGRIRQEVNSTETMEGVGVALVTSAREGEWDGCPFGLLDRDPTADCNCPPGMKFHALNCSVSPGQEIRKWLILPWLPSARNVTDAARTLARSKKSSQTQ